MIDRPATETSPVFQSEGTDSHRIGWALRIGGVIALIVLVLQVLALGSRHYHEQVNSDDLYPYVFCQDAIHGAWPVSGWTLSSAPYYFPDFAGLALLMAATGWQGASIPAYAVLSATVLAGLIGWLLRSLDPSSRDPWWRGLLAVNGLVALSLIPTVDRWVWWQFVPGFHGGAIIISVAAAILAVQEIQKGYSRTRFILLALLLWLGMLSDSFVIVETVLPILAAIIWAIRDRADFVSPVRHYIGAVATAVGLLVISKIALSWSEVFFAGRVFRYAPTPSNIFNTIILFWRDLWGERWPLTLFIIAAISGEGVALWREAKGRWAQSLQDSWVVRFMTTWTLLAAVFLVGAILVMCYWHDVSNARYLLSLHVYPVITGVALWPIALKHLSRLNRAWFNGGLLAILVVLGVISARQIDREKLSFPYPADIARLDNFFRAHHLTRGLSDYWTMHRYNVLGRAGARVSALRSTANSTYPASVASYWNSNVYTLLDRDDATGHWLKPEYSFIVVNRLDESSLVKRYGEPRERYTVGEWKIWVLAQPGTTSQLIVNDVKERLRGRRWDRVAGDLQ